MMSVEGPYLSALIARLAKPEYNLAAYGIAFSLALIVEAPVIMMMSASIALVKDYQSFLQLRKFNYWLMAILSAVIIGFITPPVFYFITEDLISLPKEVSHLTHLAVMILIPWPAAIGFRRFYQGILIRNNLTRLVAYGTMIRLAAMTLTAFVLYKFTDVPGVVVGASALSTAVVCEAIASKLMTKKIIHKLKTSFVEDQNTLTLKEIINFYYPLALTSLLTLGVQPFVTFLIGQSKMPMESFAVMPVVTSFVFIFRGLGLSYQEVVVALIGDNMTEYNQLKKFALKLGSVLAIALMIIAFTPLSEIWFRDVSGLSESLTNFAKAPLMIMSFFPALTVLISFQRAILVMAKDTKQITYGTAIEFFGIIIALAIGIKYFSLVGAIAATISFVIGRTAVCAYLTVPSIRALKLKS
jgi:O-antigen/teichoic acid export membrane protein